jgi:hypothetical protein
MHRGPIFSEIVAVHPTISERRARFMFVPQRDVCQHLNSHGALWKRRDVTCPHAVTKRNPAMESSKPQLCEISILIFPSKPLLQLPFSRSIAGLSVERP